MQHFIIHAKKKKGCGCQLKWKKNLQETKFNQNSRSSAIIDILHHTKAAYKTKDSTYKKQTNEQNICDIELLFIH